MSGIWGSITGAVDSATNTISSAYDSAAGTVSEWWNSTEDNEAAPSTYQQQATAEKLAEGSALPQRQTAQNNTGATVTKTGYTASSSTPLYLIGGGVLLVVLLMLFVMMRGK